MNAAAKETKKLMEDHAKMKLIFAEAHLDSSITNAILQAQREGMTNFDIGYFLAEIAAKLTSR